MAKITYSKTERQIVEVLKNAAEGMTLSQISEALGQELVSGNINALVKKENVKVTGKVETQTKTMSTVHIYGIGTAKIGEKATESQKIIVEELAKGENLTLAELSEKCGVTLASGTINALVKLEVVVITGEKEIARFKKGQKNVYAFAKEIDVLEGTK